MSERADIKSRHAANAPAPAPTPMPTPMPLPTVTEQVSGSTLSAPSAPSEVDHKTAAPKAEAALLPSARDMVRLASANVPTPMSDYLPAMLKGLGRQIVACAKKGHSKLNVNVLPGTSRDVSENGEMGCYVYKSVHHTGAELRSAITRELLKMSDPDHTYTLAPNSYGDNFVISWSKTQTF